MGSASWELEGRGGRGGNSGGWGRGQGQAGCARGSACSCLRSPQRGGDASGAAAACQVPGPGGERVLQGLGNVRQRWPRLDRGWEKDGWGENIHERPVKVPFHPLRQVSVTPQPHPCCDQVQRPHISIPTPALPDSAFLFPHRHSHIPISPSPCPRAWGHSKATLGCLSRGNWQRGRSPASRPCCLFTFTLCLGYFPSGSWQLHGPAPAVNVNVYG